MVSVWITAIRVLAVLMAYECLFSAEHRFLCWRLIENKGDD